MEHSVISYVSTWRQHMKHILSANRFQTSNFCQFLICLLCSLIINHFCHLRRMWHSSLLQFDFSIFFKDRLNNLFSIALNHGFIFLFLCHFRSIHAFYNFFISFYPSSVALFCIYSYLPQVNCSVFYCGFNYFSTRIANGRQLKRTPWCFEFLYRGWTRRFNYLSECNFRFDRWNLLRHNSILLVHQII